MTYIKMLEDSDYKYHDCCPFPKPEKGKTATEEMKQEQRKFHKMLPYDPAFILTNEHWLKLRIRNLKQLHPEIDIQGDCGEWFSCSMPKNYLNVCNPYLKTNLDPPKGETA